MSYTSQYNLNIRLSALEARINALVPVPPGYAYDLVSVLGVGNNAGTFDIDMNNNDILNVNNIDVATINGDTFDLNGVLTAGNTADLGFDLSLTAPTTISSISADIPVTDSTFDVGYIDTTAGTTATSTIKSQLNQTDYSASVNDTTNGLLGTKTLITIGGAVLDTNTATSSGGAVGLLNSFTGINQVTTGQQLNTGTGIVSSLNTTANATTASLTCGHVSSSFTTSTEINAQSGAVEYLGSVADTGTNLTTKRFLLSNGSVFNRDRATDGAGITVTSDELTDYTLNVSSTKTFDNGTILNTLTQTVNPVVVSQSNLFQTTGVNESLSAMNASSGNANVACSYQTILPPDIANIANMEVNTTEATSSVQAYSISGGYGHILKMNANTGSALIEHTTTLGANKNLSISTQGNMLLSSTNLDATAGNLSFTTATAGGASLPVLTLSNTGNSTSGVALEVFKDRPTSANGDVLFQESIYGRDSAGNKQEYTRITHTIRDRTNLVEDGSIELTAVVNGAFQTFIQINGNENETNFLRPLDMTGNNIRTTTGSLAINTASSATAGAVLTLATKDGTPGSGAGLALTGDTLLSGSAGGSSGQHLCLTIGGTVYKIALLNP
jgi:hypothetical protein